MHPILLKIPLPGWKLPWFGALTSIPIHSYGVMLGLSLVVGWYLTLGLAEKDGMPKETMANCYVFTAISAVLMSRLLYFVTNPEEFKSFWELFALWRGDSSRMAGSLAGSSGRTCSCAATDCRSCPGPTQRARASLLVFS